MSTTATAVSSEPAYSLVPARYSKGNMLLQIEERDTGGKGGGFGGKPRIARLAEALNARWTHRERGYVLSYAKARKLGELYAAGWDAEYLSKALVPPGAGTVSTPAATADDASDEQSPLQQLAFRVREHAVMLHSDIEDAAAAGRVLNAIECALADDAQAALLALAAELDSHAG